MPADPNDHLRNEDGLAAALRAAHKQHAEVVAQLADRDATVRALERRVELTEELAAGEAERLRTALGEAAAATADRATIEDARAELDAMARRLGDAEARLQDALTQAAAERGRLSAEVGRLEQRLAAEAGASERLARQDESEPAHLIAELAGMARALDDAQRALAAERRRAAEAPARAAPAAPGLAAGEPLEQALRAARGERSARIRELEQLVSALTGALVATRADVERAERSRAWRMGHGLTRAARKLLLRSTRTDGALVSALRRIDEVQRATRALPPAPGPAVDPDRPPAAAPAPAPPPVDAAGRERLAATVRQRLGAVPVLEHWPGVSVVVPTRDGRPQLERLVTGLRDSTDYPLLELVVVDNGSADGTAEWLAGLDDLSVQVVRNADNASFSQACEQGAQAASHDLLLMLNDDVEPFEAGWLRELVAAHVERRAAISGATLLHPEARADGTAGPRVQHRRVALRRTPEGILPYNAGDGERLLGDGFGTLAPALAVSAACLLVERATLGSLGGFSPRYRYGLEDVDLALRAGEDDLAVLANGRCVLVHAESATRHREGTDFTRVTREANRRALRQAWGPRLRRAYHQARIAGDERVTDGAGPYAAITVTSLDPGDGWGDWHTAHELAEALTACGWRVEPVAVGKDGRADLPADVDYVVTLLDRFDARAVPADVGVVAWVRNWTDRWLERPWFDRLDLVLASSSTSAALIEQRTGRRPELFPLATNAARFGSAVAQPELAVDCVFTGNHWGQDREIQAGLAPGPDQTIAIYGRGWRDVKPLARHAAGPVAYERLPGIYASARLALDDTQEPTLRYDAVNARVFDALAAGTLVLTNCGDGVRELFDDEFPTWSTASGLRTVRDALLADPERCARLVERYRETVLAEHTYAHRADRLVTLLAEREALLSFCIKIGAPDWEQAQRWGDLHFARALERELRRRGHRVVVQVLEEWENDEGLSFDVVVHLRGLSRHFTKPGQFNVLWSISHPADLTGEECDGYDLVAIASAPFAERMRGRTSTPIIVLEQATDPRLFYPDPHPDAAHHHDVVYVANSRNVLRPVLRDLLPTDLDLAVYGANWDGLIDMRHVVAEHVPNDELRRIYSSAKVVLADHWDDMREHGFVANRIYDALACGATVISDDVAGLRGRFGDAVQVYGGPEELRALIDAELAAPRPAVDAAALDLPVFAGAVDALVAACRVR